MRFLTKPLQSLIRKHLKPHILQTTRIPQSLFQFIHLHLLLANFLPPDFRLRFFLFLERLFAFSLDLDFFDGEFAEECSVGQLFHGVFFDVFRVWDGLGDGSDDGVDDEDCAVGREESVQSYEKSQGF